MTSTKLSITVRGALKRKYSATALARIETAIRAWIKADAARGFRTIHVNIDDPQAVAAYGVAPLTGAVTAVKVKEVLDALVAATAPDYIVILGADDVVPYFMTPNPSFSTTIGGDNDDEVPTDNPYASTSSFNLAKRSTYLVPDRVVGRIPDLPGSHDPSWLIDYLKHATRWVSQPAATYRKTGLSVCCALWRPSGLECMRQLGAPLADLLVSPPTDGKATALRARHKSLRHLFKCHGNDLSTEFAGEGTGGSPVVLSSAAIDGRITPGVVVGAMCCYGAKVFDPNHPAALQPGQPPIPSVYLRQGAHGFLGATTLAWVGEDTMLCADWVATSFLQHATSGASLGRAALEAKQDLLRWLQQQGLRPDRADEKTLLQFVLLGDPSIHPVLPSTAKAGPKPASTGPVATTLSAVTADTSQRRMRRRMRFNLGRILREGLPDRQALRAADPLPTEVTEVARVLLARFKKAKAADIASAPTMAERLTQSAVVPAFAGLALASLPGGATAEAEVVAEDGTFQYCWIVPLGNGGLRRVGMVTVQADESGRVMNQRAVVSS